MPQYTVTDFVADQLRAQNPAADWNSQGIDRAQELARILVRNDIIDLTKLMLTVVDVSEAGFAFGPAPATHKGLCFWYENRYVGFMGTPDRADKTAEFENTLIAWSAAGHGNVGYDVIPAQGGFKITVNWASSSDAAEIRGEILQVSSLAISLVLPIAGINVAAQLGQAVLGSIFGAVSPTLAAAVGQTALSTVFNGGDVEKAVRDVVINLSASQAGAFVGGHAADFTESQLAGKLASAATTAVVSGKELGPAVGMALVRSGIAAVNEPQSTNETPAPTVAPVATAAQSDPATIEPNGAQAMSYDGDPYSSDVLQADSSGVVDLSGFDESYWTGPTSDWATNGGAGLDVGAGGPVYSTTADIRTQLIAAEQQAAENPVQASDPWGTRFKDIVTNIGTFGAGVIAVVKTIDRVRTVVTNSRTTNADGTTTVALDNGLVVTKDAQGNVIGTARPPVGTGQTTVTGKIVANLGDGTYSLTSPDGTRRVIKYDPQLSSASIFDTLAANPVPLMLAGAGIVAALIKRR